MEMSSRGGEGRASSSSAANEGARRATSSRAEAEAASLRALKQRLANVPHDEKSALVHVQRVAPQLLDEDHILSFLQGEDCYNVDLALRRLVRHWSQRYKIFGPDKYALPMTLNGAMRDCVGTLQRGYITVLPVRDEAGRAIIYVNSAVQMPTTEEKLQMLWYLLHVMMQDRASLRCGCIAIANARVSSLRRYDPKFYSQGASVLDRCFPIEWKRMHVCHANAVFPLVAQAVRAILPKVHQQSLLLHNGSDERVLETLSEHGLPKRCVPSDLGGTLHVSTDAFVRDRLKVEGGSLERDERIARSLSPSHDGDVASNQDIKVGVVAPNQNREVGVVASNQNVKVEEKGALIHNSYCPGVTGPEAKAIESNGRPRPECNSADAVVANNNFTPPFGHNLNPTPPVPGGKAPHDFAQTLVRGTPPAAQHNFKPTPPVPAGKAPHDFAQKPSEQKRKNDNDPKREGKKARTVRGDPRMNRAVRARAENPHLTLTAAMVAGGFVFPNLNAQGVHASEVRDADGVTLYQRRNQLLRRLRRLKRN